MANKKNLGIGILIVGILVSLFGIGSIFYIIDHYYRHNELSYLSISFASIGLFTGFLLFSAGLIFIMKSRKEVKVLN